MEADFLVFFLLFTASVRSWLPGLTLVPGVFIVNSWACNSLACGLYQTFLVLFWISFPFPQRGGSGVLAPLSMLSAARSCWMAGLVTIMPGGIRLLRTSVKMVRWLWRSVWMLARWDRLLWYCHRQNQTLSQIPIPALRAFLQKCQELSRGCRVIKHTC